MQELQDMRDRDKTKKRNKSCTPNMKSAHNVLLDEDSCQENTTFHTRVLSKKGWYVETHTRKEIQKDLGCNCESLT